MTHFFYANIIQYNVTLCNKKERGNSVNTDQAFDLLKDAGE